MRKALAGLLILVLSIPLSSLAAVSAPKAGNACPKNGATQSYKGLKFTCIKSGKKLIWNHGVKIPNKNNSGISNPSSPPSNSLSPNPSVSPTSDVLPTPVPSPSTIRSKEYLDYLQRKRKAYEEIRTIAVPILQNRIQIKYSIGSNYPKDVKDYNINQVETASLIYSYFLDKEIPTTIYLYTEKEESQILSIPILWRYSSWEQEIKPWFDEWKIGKRYETNIGLAAWFMVDSSDDGGHAGIAMASASNLTILEPWGYQSLPHEFFHVIQDYYFRPRGIGFDGDNSYSKSFPPMFREGSADTFSIAVTCKTFEEYLNFYKKEVATSTKRIDLLKNISGKEDMKTVLSKITSKSSDPDAHYSSYYTGALLYEWFISEFGIDKYRALLQSELYGGPFDALLKQIVGINSEQLNSMAAEYVYQGLSDLS